MALSFSNVLLASTLNHAPMRSIPLKYKMKSMHMVPYDCQTHNGAVKPVSSSALTGPNHAQADQMEAAASGHGSSVLSPNGKDYFTGEMHHQDISILDFLRGKNLFVTGATGFLAKVLLEKILRSSPDVDKIFVLVKAKDEGAAVERLKNEIIGSELFKFVKQIHGKSYETFMLSKLVPLVGNIHESNLGLDEDAAELLAKKVDVIINSAANTTFDERYDTSLDTNTSGAMRMMNFAKQCHKLKLFVHISTAYVNGRRQGRVMEKPFCLGQSIQHEMISKPHASSILPKLSVEGEINLVLESKQALEDHSVHQEMKKLGMQRANTFGWQDTYSFTKAMGEMMIDSVRGDIPVVMIRPSIVESTYKEPFAGWIEGNRMIDPVIMLYGKGYLTSFLADPNGVLDIIPADMVVNAILAAMAKHAKPENRKTTNNIYHVASSVVNPMVIKDAIRFSYEHFSSSPFIDSKGSPVGVAPMKLFSSMEDLSADLWRNIDAINKGASSNCKLVRKLVDHAKHLADIYQPYTFYAGRFDNSNTKSLMECMSEEERGEFGFDVESIDWEDYISNVHIGGLRRHVFRAT